MGARFYKNGGIKYNNPFMWMTISFDDFLLLFKNYDEIDFNKKTFSLEKYRKRPDTSVLCKVENKLNLHYIHFIQDDNYKVPTKRMKSADDVSILTNDAIGYCKEKYETRLSRMTEKPIFLYSFNYSYITDEEYVREMDLLISNAKKYSIILLLHDKEFIRKKIQEIKNKNVKCIVIPNDIISLDGALIIKKLENEITNSISECNNGKQ